MCNHLDLDDDALQAPAQPASPNKYRGTLTTKTVGAMFTNTRQSCPLESQSWHSQICPANLQQETVPEFRL
jgi:hypothetical protein